MIGKKHTKQFASSLLGLGFAYASVDGQEDRSHLEYKIPSNAIKSELLKFRDSNDVYYRKYAIDANNRWGKEIVAWEYFKDDNLVKLELLKNKQKHGIWKTWYANGQLESQASYNKDVMDGSFKTWNESGQLTSSYTLRNGSGQKRMYHDNGMLKVDQRYEDNVITGDYVTLYDNGQVRSLSWRRGNSNIGFSFSFQRDGSLNKIITFDKNIKNSSTLKGVVVSFSDDGSFDKIEYRMGHQTLTKKKYLEVRRKTPSLPPVYDDPHQYKNWYTQDMEALIESYKKIKPIKIPLEFGKSGNPLSKEGKPVIFPDLNYARGR